MASDITTGLDTAIGRIRFRIGDDDRKTAQFTNAQITQILGDEADEDHAVGVLLQSLAVRRARFGAPDGDGGTDILRSIASTTYGSTPQTLPTVVVTYGGRHPSDPTR